MPGSTPATSQLDWLISMTAMIVLFWSRARRDLLKSFGWGIAALHRFMQRRSCHFLAARPIASLGSARGRSYVRSRDCPAKLQESSCEDAKIGALEAGPRVLVIGACKSRRSLGAFSLEK